MIEMKLTFEGGKELAKELEELPRRLQNKTIRKALRQAGNVLLKKARTNAPVKSGALRRGIKLKVDMRGTPAAIINVKIPGKGKKSGGGPYYGAFQELGTSKMPAHPYLRPAFDSTNKQALDTFVEVLDTGVEEETKLL